MSKIKVTVEAVISCLDLFPPEGIKMIGIFGCGGIGKSTIARAVYDSIADHFEGSFFLSNAAMHTMKLGLRRKKILLILDDVDELYQLDALAGRFDLGHGSRIIIISRNKQLLALHAVKSMKELNAYERIPHERVLDASLELSYGTLGEEHVETFDDPQNYDAANPSSSTMNFGLWEKVECIGAGRFGIVHVGRNRRTGGLCAIKEILHIDDPLSAQSLQQEIQILSGLQHPNIVKYYDSQTVGSQMSIYMEYVHPGSLKKYIERQGALTISLVQDFTAQILFGLAYIHKQGVVHRDIKGDNILVDSENNIVKLADFGLAKKLAESVGKHSVSGTICYAAPELLWGGVYNSSGEGYAADIWSLGCVVIEMLTGKQLWPDCTNQCQVMYQIGCLGKHPQIPEDLSDAGKNFLRGCFTRDPAMRPSSEELLSDPFVRIPVEA